MEGEVLGSPVRSQVRQAPIPGPRFPDGGQVRAAVAGYANALSYGILSLGGLPLGGQFGTVFADGELHDNTGLGVGAGAAAYIVAGGQITLGGGDCR